MRKLNVVLWILAAGILSLVLWVELATSATCPSQYAPYIGGWKPIYSAPRDGSPIEILSTYGILPSRSIRKWSPQPPGWVNVRDTHLFYEPTGGCLYWRLSRRH